MGTEVLVLVLLLGSQSLVLIPVLVEAHTLVLDIQVSVFVLKERSQLER